MTMIRLRGTAMTVLVPFPSLHTTSSLLRELGRKSHAGGSGRGRPRAGRACGCEPRAQLSGVGKVATTLTAASNSWLRATTLTPTTLKPRGTGVSRPCRRRGSDNPHFDRILKKVPSSGAGQTVLILKYEEDSTDQQNGEHARLALSLAFRFPL